MSPVFPEGSQGCCAASTGETGLVWGGKHRLGVPVNSAHEAGSPGQRGGFEMSPAPVPMLVPQWCCVVQPGLLGGPVPQMGAVLQGAHVGHGPGSLDGATAGSLSTVPTGLVAWLHRRWQRQCEEALQAAQVFSTC